MGFFSTAWNAARAVGRGVMDVFRGVAAVLVLAVYAIGYAIFSIIGHLYTWIDGILEKHGNKVKTTIMVPPDETQTFLDSLPDGKGRTILPAYPRCKPSLMVATDQNGKVITAQVATTEKGFDKTIEDAFKQGNLVEQPIGY